jgi:hypothetical protein
VVYTARWNLAKSNKWSSTWKTIISVLHNIFQSESSVRLTQHQDYWTLQSRSVSFEPSSIYPVSHLPSIISPFSVSLCLYMCGNCWAGVFQKLNGLRGIRLQRDCQQWRPSPTQSPWCLATALGTGQALLAAEGN